jgi:putative heme-binding domain-containing protein
VKTPGLFAFLALCAMQSSAVAQHAGQYEAADIEYGARLYGGHCINCHGESGDLMPGANLRSGVFRNAPTDRDLTGVIRDGIAGTAMTATGYTDSELTALVAYLRNMTSFDPSGAAVGDPLRGEAIFRGKGDCLACHRVGGEGPRFAPDLSDVGGERTAALLHRVLIDPSDGLVPVNRPVRIVTSTGETLLGRRLNEDTFTVQVIDDRERLRSFDKAALREYSVSQEATMPSYAQTLSESERADVVAYLLSLKGKTQ